MTSYVAKLGAIVAAGALIATAALPAYADLGPAVSATPRSASVQTVALASAVSPVALVSASRDGYSVTVPKPVVVVAVNRYVPASIPIAAPAQAYSGAALIQYAAKFVGVVPYGMGNSPDTSFSCDGFTQYVFAGFGINLPRTADAQARLGVRISKADAVAGDFVYWPGQHIGIYDGAGGMYNSPTWGRYVEHVATLWGSPLFIRLTL